VDNVPPVGRGDGCHYCGSLKGCRRVGGVERCLNCGNPVDGAQAHSDADSSELLQYGWSCGPVALSSLVLFSTAHFEVALITAAVFLVLIVAAPVITYIVLKVSNRPSSGANLAVAVMINLILLALSFRLIAAIPFGG